LALARHDLSLPDTRVFFDALYADLDAGRRFTVWTLPSKVTRWFADPDEAAQAVAGMPPKTDVYSSIAFATEAVAEVLGPRQRISIATAAGIVGLGADLDFATPAKPNCRPTEADAQRILDALPIPPTLVVSRRALDLRLRAGTTGRHHARCQVAGGRSRDGPPRGRLDARLRWRPGESPEGAGLRQQQVQAGADAASVPGHAGPLPPSRDRRRVRALRRGARARRAATVRADHVVERRDTRPRAMGSTARSSAPSSTTAT